jgi:hypothetical protein
MPSEGAGSEAAAEFRPRLISESAGDFVGICTQAIVFYKKCFDLLDEMRTQIRQRLHVFMGLCMGSNSDQPIVPLPALALGLLFASIAPTARTIKSIPPHDP